MFLIQKGINICNDGFPDTITEVRECIASLICNGEISPVHRSVSFDQFCILQIGDDFL